MKLALRLFRTLHSTSVKKALLSMGLPCQEHALAEVTKLGREGGRAYVVVSGSLAKNTKEWDKLKETLGKHLVRYPITISYAFQ